MRTGRPNNLELMTQDAQLTGVKLNGCRDTVGEDQMDRNPKIHLN